MSEPTLEQLGRLRLIARQLKVIIPRPGTRAEAAREIDRLEALVGGDARSAQAGDSVPGVPNAVYLTVTEVAERMRCEHRTVRRAIRRGELEAAQIAGRWLIREEAVDTWFGRRVASIPPELRRPRRRATTSRRRGSIARLRAIEQGGHDERSEAGQ